jgi:hypothetical protein
MTRTGYRALAPDRGATFERIHLSASLSSGTAALAAATQGRANTFDMRRGRLGRAAAAGEPPSVRHASLRRAPWTKQGPPTPRDAPAAASARASVSNPIHRPPGALVKSDVTAGASERTSRNSSHCTSSTSLRRQGSLPAAPRHDLRLQEAFADLARQSVPRPVQRRGEVGFFGPRSLAVMADRALKLASGASVPRVGLGTWKAPPGATAAIVKRAIMTGYRHIDAACDYGNEVRHQRSDFNGSDRAGSDGVGVTPDVAGADSRMSWASLALPRRGRSVPASKQLSPLAHASGRTWYVRARGCL